MLEERLRLDRAPPFGSFQLIGTDDLWLMKEAIVEHGGYRIRVRTRGPAGGPHALVLPGMGDTEFTLVSQIRTLRDLGYQTHFVELPGLGLTPAPHKACARNEQHCDIVTRAATRISAGE